LIISIIYVQYGSLPEVEGIFLGINPVVAAILTTAFIRLGKSAFTDYRTILIAVASFVAALFGINDIPIIFAGGLLAILLYSASSSNLLPLFMGFFSFTQAKPIAGNLIKNQLVQLGLFFLKVGALLFGSTYMLIAFIQTDVVEKYHWLSHQQMLDAVAAGQITPGPISSTATFVGYVIAGFPGALVATLGMFVPSFLIVILTGKYLPKLNKIPVVQYFLKGVTASAVALIANVTLSVYQSAITDISSGILAAVALIAMLFYKMDAFWAIVGGVIFGLVRTFLF
jgi:chromate transporter